MGWAEELTDAEQRITLFVAFNYGGRAEILDAARRFTGATEEEFRDCLYAPEMHDPDLIIRTSGERRLSNYLLWQSAYSELVFRDELWPDFTREALEQSLAEFSERRRRFGGLMSAQARVRSARHARARAERRSLGPRSDSARARACPRSRSRCSS